MKKLFILMLCMVLLVGTVSAFEFDNWKSSYDEETKTIVIDNAFTLGDEILSATLNTPQVYKVGIGYQKVAQFTISPKQDYENVINNLEFQDINNDNQKVNIVFDLKYLTLVPREVGVYEEICGKAFLNGSQNCNYVQTDTEIVYDEEWLNYDNTIKTDIEITIGLFTTTYKNQRIEWVPSLVGVQVLEWAVWDSSLNVGLVSWFKLEQDGGDYIPYFPINTTLTNDPTFETGKVNNAMTLNGTFQHAINTTTHETLTWGNASSFSVWFNVTGYNTDGGNGSQIVGNYLNANDRFSIGVNGSGYAGFKHYNGTSTPTQTTTNPVSLNTWYHLAGITYTNGTQILWLDGAKQSGANSLAGIGNPGDTDFTIGQRGGGFIWFQGQIDELGIWNRTLTDAEVTILYNVGNGCTLDLCGVTSPIVNNNIPVNLSNFTISNIVFSGNASDDSNLVNLSLYIGGVLNQTNSSVFNATQTNFTVALNEGTYDWFYSGWDNETPPQNTNGTGMRFTIDKFDPSVTIINPINDTIFTGYTTITNLSVIINHTATDVNLNTCWIDYLNGTNTTITCNTNITLTEEPYSINTYRIWANDTLGKTGHADRTATFDFNVLERSVTNNDPITEGSTETFSIKFNVSTSLTPSSVNITYNGTDYLATLTGSANPYVANVTFTVPPITSTQVFNFSWNVLLSDGFYYSSEVFNQTVTTLGVDDCSSFTNVIYNFTVVDEANQTLLTNPTNNVTLEINVDVFDLLRSVEILNYSNITSGINPVAVCLNTSLFSTTAYSLDTVIKYEANGYSVEYYHIENFTADNSTLPQEITLYDLISTDTTEFQITFKDSNFNTVEGALVFIQRQYISENNSFKTVELPKTDSNGQTLGHFVEKDVIYNILVTNGTTGEVLGTFNNVIAFCQDATIGDCIINLNALTSGEAIYNFELSREVALTTPLFNGTSRLLSMDFYTFDGTSKEVNMSAIVYDQLGDTVACANTVTSSSGTLSCTVPSGFGNSSLQIFVYVDGDLIVQDYVPIDTTETYGDAGLLILFFMILVLVMMFIDSKTGVLIALIIGLIAGGSYSLIIGDAIGLGASILWLIIAVSLTIWKLNKEKG